MRTFKYGESGNSASNNLRLVQSESGEEVEICRLEPGEAYRTLGAWIAADGGQGKQLEVLAAKVTVWINSIIHSSLSSHDK